MTRSQQKSDRSTPSAAIGRSLGGPLVLSDEGSFFVHGRVVATEWPNVPNTDLDAPGHSTVEQMYVHYRVPERGNGMPPLVMVHGSNHTGTTWETTPDGREGWATWFVRQGFSVYVVDHSGRGRSGFAAPTINRAIGESSLGTCPPIPVASHERGWVNFRIGPRYGEAFPGTQFPLEAFEHYTAQLVPNSEVTLQAGGATTVAALAELLDLIGPAIVMAHSQSGAYGMALMRCRHERIRAFINIEGDMAPVSADEIAATFVPVPALALWGDFSIGARGRNGDVRRNGCRDSVAAINAAGGRASLLMLPDIGIKGNSHMLMLDRNNLDVAAQVLRWIEGVVKS